MTHLAVMTFFFTAMALLVAVLAYDLYDRFRWRKFDAEARRAMMRRIEARRKDMGML